VPHADRGCEYELTREDYTDLVGSARNWDRFLEQKTADGGDTWTCPHARADGKRECVFHLDPLEVPDGVDEGAALIEAVERSDDADGSGRYRHKQFIGATFGDLHLGGATIGADDGEPLDFTGATFERDVSASATIEQPVVLAHATIEQWRRTDLAGTTFEGTVNAREATVRDPLLCNDALFARGANFEGATFANAVNFDRTVFGNTASFQSVTFGGETLFRGTTFRSRANFVQSVAHRGLDFERATFRGVADFKQCALGGYVWFPRVTFEADAEFRESVFTGEADFEEAIFERAAAFGRTLMHGPAEFRGPTTFARADLAGAAFADVALVGATFDGADLTEATLTNCDLRLAGLETAILSRASLFDADLRGSALSGAVMTDARINDATRLLHPPTDDLPVIASVPKGVTALARRVGVVPADTATSPACGYDPAFHAPTVAPEGGDTVTGSDGEATTRDPSETVATLTSLIDGLDAASLPTGPDPDLDPPETDLDDAKSVYRAIETVADMNSRPRLQGRAFVRRQDVQARQYRTAVADAETVPGMLAAGLRLARSTAARASLLYGESPWRVIGIGLGTIVGFGLLYPVGGWLETTGGGSAVTYGRIATEPALLWRSIYHSAMMFATGNQYGGVVAANGPAQLLASIEALLGPTLLALLVFVLGRRAAR
jgi:uncharacterized protein YjbI with pentapeptide repeats